MSHSLPHPRCHQTWMWCDKSPAAAVSAEVHKSSVVVVAAIWWVELGERWVDGWSPAGEGTSGFSRDLRLTPDLIKIWEPWNQRERFTENFNICVFTLWNLKLKTKKEYKSWRAILKQELSSSDSSAIGIRELCVRLIIITCLMCFQKSLHPESIRACCVLPWNPPVECLLRELLWSPALN